MKQTPAGDSGAKGFPVLLAGRKEGAADASTPQQAADNGHQEEPETGCVVNYDPIMLSLAACKRTVFYIQTSPTGMTEDALMHHRLHSLPSFSFDAHVYLSPCLSGLLGQKGAADAVCV